MTLLDDSRAAPARAARCWTLVGDEGAVDVEVEALDTDTLDRVVPVLADAVGVPVAGLWADDVRLPGHLPLSAPALAHGVVLGLGRAVPPQWRTVRGSPLELHVLGGPDAGRSFPLGHGRHVLGRSAAAAIPLQDPDVSRHHLEVFVGRGQITVADLGSTNGSRIDGIELSAEPQQWPIGAVVRLGTTALTVAAPAHGAASLAAGTGGRVRIRPVPRHEPPPVDVEVAFPRPPAPPPARRLAWVAVALPAVGGVLMAWLLDAPTFLFFALLSPVVALGTWVSDRWTGRRSGRREAAAHAQQVLEAEERREHAIRAATEVADAAHPDLATVTTAARRRTDLLWSRAAADADALTVRLGTGPGPTRVVCVHADGAREPQTAVHVPGVVDLRRDGGLAVIGPREYADGVLAAIVTRLTAVHPPDALALHLLVDAARLTGWQWARWLPHLRPSGVVVASSGPAASGPDGRLLAALTDLIARQTVATGRSGSSSAPSRWTVVVVDRALDPRLVAVLREARAAGVVVLSAATSPSDVPVPLEATFRLTGETGDAGLLRRRGLADLSLTSVDRLPVPAAARFARDLAPLDPDDATATLPRSVRLLEVAHGGLRIDETDRVTGDWAPDRRHLHAVLGRTANGPAIVDLCQDGPHALVAGTTGSGKSELLQTLITSLALHHPPRTCTFLLVDYKGGAAFAEAAALPHTVGVVTDLDSRATTRALRSLDAELVRRESILAGAHVADLADLPDDVDLARLVIVVDEFATLAEELPTFVPGLVSIAQRGRSLGVHLVLATQRPGGVVSPEIRANISLRLCLRTTDEGDSRDVLGIPSAAFLPADVPGRAYLRTGNATPQLFQVARVATAGTPVADPGPAVRRWTWPTPPGRPAESSPGTSDLSRVTAAITAHARRLGERPPHRPWRPPLPDHLDAGARPPGPGTRLSLGVIDLPDEQAQRPLELDLAAGGTWLAVGGPRSGRTTLLRTVLREAAFSLRPDDLHVHVLDPGGGPLATEAAGCPHTGTVVGGDDRLRTIRLVQRLAEEVATRRSRPPGADRPAILLLVDGMEQLLSVVEEADPGNGSALLTRLVRDGAAAGLTCVATADRAIPGGRLAALARHRLVLPLADRADYAVAGVPPRAVPEHRPPGRALFGEDLLECQLALPRAGWQPRADARDPRRLPLRIPELPADPVLPPLLPLPDEGRLHLVVGPGGDEGRPLTLDLRRTGGLLVAGPPGSGRTSALDAFVGQLHALEIPVLRLGDPASWIDQTDEAAVRAWVDALGEGPGAVVVDDLGAPAECPALAALARSGNSASRIAVVAAGAPAQLAGHFQGPVAALRRARTGLLLCPGPGDADLLGVRLPRTPVPVRPGSGWLVSGGAVDRVQVARRRGPGRPP